MCGCAQGGALYWRSLTVCGSSSSNKQRCAGEIGEGNVWFLDRKGERRSDMLLLTNKAEPASHSR
jgi:hypothetical protein